MQNTIKAHLNQKGFTLIELLVVIAMIGLLASIVLISLNDARSKSRRAAALANQRELAKAVDLYLNDMGFYPPDVNSGVDPGFAKPLPINERTGEDCNIDVVQCSCPLEDTVLSCGDGQIDVPVNWIAQVQSRWRGPYLTKWPQSSPWGGVYDYNYFPYETEFGTPPCTVPGGVYIGIQPADLGAGAIPVKDEQFLVQTKSDSDGCVNQSIQLILYKFPVL